MLPSAPPCGRALRRRNSVPQIFIGSTHVGGCDDIHDLERTGKLDPLAGCLMTKIGIVQMRSATDMQRNLVDATALVREAAAQGRSLCADA